MLPKTLELAENAAAEVLTAAVIIALLYEQQRARTTMAAEDQRDPSEYPPAGLEFD